MTDQVTMDKNKFKKRIKFLPNGCWENTLGKEKSGYTRICVNNKRYGGHRFAWILWKGEIPAGLQILHKCDNRPCVNPSHLFVGGPSENQIDCVLKGRNPNAKLNPKKVKEIRRRISNGEGIRELGREFNVCHKTICEINNGVRWNHVK